MGKNKIDQFNCATLRSGSNDNKKISAKYFDGCIIFRGVSQALKFNIENAMACSYNIYLKYLYCVILTLKYFMYLIGHVGEFRFVNRFIYAMKQIYTHN